jgi:hypothetical protein
LVSRKEFPLSDPDIDAFLADDDDAFIDAFIKFACPPLFDPLAGMDLNPRECRGFSHTGKYHPGDPTAWLTRQSAANPSARQIPCYQGKNREFPVLCSKLTFKDIATSQLLQHYAAMAEPHVVSALCIKRAEISGHIAELERKINRQRAALANVDATIRLFSPGTNPDAIPPKRAYRRTRYFARNELSRLMRDALRTASMPLTSAEIAAAVMQAKGMPANDTAFKEIVAARALTVLRRLAKRGAAVKSGTSRDAKWALCEINC